MSIGGALVPPYLHLFLEGCLGIGGPGGGNCIVVNGYGATETGGIARDGEPLPQWKPPLQFERGERVCISKGDKPDTDARAHTRARAQSSQTDMGGGRERRQAGNYGMRNAPATAAARACIDVTIR